MKIKRFEAENMAEALRQIKKEFGEEAVILSAKTMKKGKRLLGKKETQLVVVTAAVDKISDPGPSKTDLNAEENNKTSRAVSAEVGREGAYYAGSSILKRFNPITRTGQKILKPKFVRLMSRPDVEKDPPSFVQRLIAAGLNEETAAEWGEQLGGLLPEDGCLATEIQHALSQVIQARGIVGSRHQSMSGKQQCVVMMGPAGGGKTSAVAKLAAKLSIEQQNSVAIISSDNQRVAGATELERYAKIIGAPFTTAFTTEKLTDNITHLRSFPFIIIDTPAIAPDDPSQIEKLKALIDCLDNAEKVLMLNTALQEKTISKIIDHFLPMSIHSLCFTHLDWAVDMGTMINMAEKHDLPIGYLSHSSRIPEGFRTATADRLSEMLLEGEGCDEGLVNDHVSVVQKTKQKKDPHYVANRNSDIFHFHACKSVQRINADNMIVFKDPAEAIGQHFKPCRMCCGELIVPKPIDRLARGYAGNRY